MPHIHKSGVLRQVQVRSLSDPSQPDLVLTWPCLGPYFVSGLGNHIMGHARPNIHAHDGDITYFNCNMDCSYMYMYTYVHMSSATLYLYGHM
jgi:hypothetical protein